MPVQFNTVRDRLPSSFAAYKKAENEKREHKDRVDRRGCAWKLCVAADVESFTILVFWYLGEASESHA